MLFSLQPDHGMNYPFFQVCRMRPVYALYAAPAHENGVWAEGAHTCLHSYWKVHVGMCTASPGFLQVEPQSQEKWTQDPILSTKAISN